MGHGAIGLKKVGLNQEDRMENGSCEGNGVSMQLERREQRKQFGQSQRLERPPTARARLNDMFRMSCKTTPQRLREVSVSSNIQKPSNIESRKI